MDKGLTLGLSKQVQQHLLLLTTLILPATLAVVNNTCSASNTCSRQQQLLFAWTAMPVFLAGFCMHCGPGHEHAHDVGELTLTPPRPPAERYGSKACLTAYSTKPRKLVFSVKLSSGQSVGKLSGPATLQTEVRTMVRNGA